MHSGRALERYRSVVRMRILVLEAYGYGYADRTLRGMTVRSADRIKSKPGASACCAILRSNDEFVAGKLLDRLQPSVTPWLTSS